VHRPRTRLALRSPGKARRELMQARMRSASLRSRMGSLRRSAVFASGRESAERTPRYTADGAGGGERVLERRG
jgi:hypothetical protein